MNDNADPVAPASDPAEADDLVREFRVVTIAGKRHGFRLERLYWRLLDAMARRRGERRSVVIAAILGRDADAGNAASAVRGFVTRTLADERDTLSEVLARANLVRLLQQAPIPAFSINRQKHVQLVNSEFNQLIKVVVGNMKQTVPTDRLQLNLDVRIDTLFAEAEAKGWTACSYTISLGDRSRRGRTKLVAVPPHPSDVLVGFVVS